MFEINRKAALLKGETTGLEKGRLEEKHETARHLLADGISIEKVSQFKGLSVFEINWIQVYTFNSDA